MAKKTGNMRPPFPVRNNYMWVWLVILAVILGWSFLGGGAGAPVETDWNSVREMIAQGEVTRIEVVNKERAEVELTEAAADKYREQKAYRNMPREGVQLVFNIGSVDTFRADLDEVEAESGHRVVLKYRARSGWGDMLISFLPWLVLIGFWIFLMRGMRGGASGGGNIMSVGKARAQVFDKENANRITFKDVAGLEEAKVEIMEIVDFLRKPQKYKELGGKIPKGALLVGPPGTGKTLLAKAVAGEANVPFLSISGSDFVEMFVGVGASRVRDLFQQAKEKAPCIVFIDEIDAIGRARGKNAGFSGNDERENTLNQLLTEMDGFGTNSGVIVLAATNRADILDKALMRAGRFDRQIEVGLPDLKEREEIFGVHLRNLKVRPDLDRSFLARQTAGFSGADIANVCNEAALIAARHDKKMIGKEDFLAAIDRIVGGLEKKHIVMTPEERRATAVHEAGHATVMWMMEHSDPVVKVTIVPRGKSLGATWYLPEERVHTTREHFMENMAGLLAGRVSEQVNFGTVGTGALNDLERVSKLAYAMVTYYGMSERLGNVSFYDSTGQRDAFTKPFSEETAHEIDEEVRAIIDEAYAMARAIVERYNPQINELADELLRKETVFAEEMERIFGPSRRDQLRAGRSDEPHARPVSSDPDPGSGSAGGVEAARA